LEEIRDIDANSFDHIRPSSTASLTHAAYLHAILRGKLRIFSSLHPPPVVRPFAGARTGVSDYTGFAPNHQARPGLSLTALSSRLATLRRVDESELACCHT